ncbi:MAG: hypothetical protein H7318_17645 [Oligoflexus sp.]|nr:hypothetical protein [Oligoflexus sp.]
MFAIFPEILQQAEKGDLEAVACLVRKYFGEQQVFVPNLRVAELCSNAEIKIDNTVQKGAARLEAWDANGQFRIVFSIHPEIKSIREQNYILAQLLGHVFLDLQPKMAKGELQRTIFEKKTSPLRALLLEPNLGTAVDEFALSLLLPKGMVKKALSTLSSRKDAAAFFNVELPLLELRLERLGLFGAEKAPVITVRPARPRTETTTQKPVAPRAAATPAAADVRRERTTTPPEAKNEKPLVKATKSEAKLSNQDLSSLARVNRSVAARTYKMEGERTEMAPPASASPGLERLRQLARKIDKSVDE